MAAMAAAPPYLLSRHSRSPLPNTNNTFLRGSRSLWSIRPTRRCLLSAPPARGASRLRTALAVRASSVSAAPAAAAAVTLVKEKTVQRLKSIYIDKVVPALLQEFKYSNKLEVPRVEKVVINCGSGEAAQNAKLFEAATKDISTVAGQRPVVTRARKAVAGFKIRKDMPVGLTVTLRGELMYSFLDRLLNLALPRTRDFLGVNPNSFDGKGNFNLGLRELTVFPEIKFENIDKPRGIDVCIVTSAKTDKEGQKLLSLLGLPFREGGITKVRVVKKKTGKFFGKGGKRK